MSGCDASSSCCGSCSGPQGTVSPGEAAPEPVSPAATAGPSLTSLFAIPEMDCPAEERLVRLALQPVAVVLSLAFDLSARELRVVHRGEAAVIEAALQPLGMGARWCSSTVNETEPEPQAILPDVEAGEARVLRWLLGLNAMMFVVELITGWWAQSTGLIADSLDMLADASVYALALMAVGRGVAHQMRAARLSGALQLALAVGVLVEVVRRAVTGSSPEPTTMSGVAVLALAVNLTCVVLLMRHRDGGVHMRASWIFTSTDALANLAVIGAGALVAWTGSNVPDLVIGLLIALLVADGARRILRLKG